MKNKLLLASTAFLALSCPSRADILQARPALTLLDTIGVHVHFERQGWTPGPGPEPWAYESNTKIINALRYSGIKHTRGSCDTAARCARTVADLTASGAKIDLIALGTASGGSWGYYQQRDWARAHPGLIEAVEGHNEIDGFGSTWIPDQGSIFANAVAVQKQIWTDYGARGVPTYSMTFINPDVIPRIGNISPWVHFANFHNYPHYCGCQVPTYDFIKLKIPKYTAMAPGRQPVITEAGWWDLPGNSGTSETTGAKLKVMFLLDAYELGIRRVYFYELLNGLRTPAASNWNNFGLFHYDGSPKQSAFAIHNLNAILADPRQGVNLGELNFTLTGMPARGHKLLFQKSDRSFWLAIWDDALIFNNAGADMNPPSSWVTLKPTARPASMTMYRPTVSNAQSRVTTEPTLTFLLGKDPVLIRIAS